MTIGPTTLPGGTASDPASRSQDEITLQTIQEQLITDAESGSVTGNRYFDYGRGQPNLFRLMRFKQRLIRDHGREAGFVLYRQSLKLPHSDCLIERHLAEEYRYAKANAADFIETGPKGERFVLSPPTIFGEGNHREIVSFTRPSYLGSIVDATVRGRSAVIETVDAALLDFHSDEQAQLDDELDWDPAIFCASRDAGSIISPTGRSRTFELDAAFILSGCHTDFFGHWMCEYLPKFIAARQSGLLPPVPILIDGCMPSSHREALEFLSGGQLEIVELAAFEIVHIRRLWFAPALMYMPLHEKRNDRFKWETVAASPARFEPVLREMGQHADRALGKNVGVPRVYLARRDSRHRRLINRHAIEAAVAARGFVIVYPEDLSFPEQVACVRNAHFLVAPEGSALFLGFFLKPGAKICVLTHPLTDVLADYNGLFGSQGVNMIAITGPFQSVRPETPHDSDYTIDVAEFCCIIDDWLNGNVS